MLKRENRYAVIKWSDACECLSDEGFNELNDILRLVSEYRDYSGKRNLSCVVVEYDWPEYEVVWKMIEDRVSTK